MINEKTYVVLCNDGVKLVNIRYCSMLLDATGFVCLPLSPGRVCGSRDRRRAAFSSRSSAVGRAKAAWQ